MGGFAARLLALFAVAAPGEGASEPHLVDMVVARVDTTVITLSELVRETRLVLLQTGGPEVARAAQLSDGLLASVLRNMVSRELLLGEVRRLKLRDVPELEVRRAIEHLREAFASPADYERFLERAHFLEPGAGEARALGAPAGLVEIILAELQVERFLDVRVRRNVVVRDAEISRCFEANRASFGGRTLDEVRGVISARLMEQHQERALRALIAQLERRANVRFTAGFDAAAPGPEPRVGLDCPEPSPGAAGESGSSTSRRPTPRPYGAQSPPAAAGDGRVE